MARHRSHGYAYANIGAPIALPAGYNSANLSWHEPFTSLDTTKWNTWIGDPHNGRWTNSGQFALPLSAENSGGNIAEYYDPAQLSFAADGLTITATKDATKAGYTWRSGAICTANKWSTPLAARSLVRVVSKMPDLRSGAWPAFWRLDLLGLNEYDDFEGGMTTDVNIANRYCSSNLQPNNPQVNYDSGVDLVANYDTWDTEFIPGASIKGWFNGALKVNISTSVPSVQYEIIFNLQMAQANSGWRRIVDGTTPDPTIWKIKLLEVYT